MWVNDWEADVLSGDIGVWLVLCGVLVGDILLFRMQSCSRWVTM